ncbi:M23 family metallopeptidase [Treponema brennaborense]|uniref:Peptidase M23 n=1 Tax=Treponema brennaborense (strain DSM 12168 / CIP 105900 / DD5/3) TaxID=906968 RepID=F4LQ10_TREBD|nr:M23 family metallopeptidase [Treponema brennaborense]AEE17088.1 Peptidase M23 [Treponema brennaborense DSM 12168]
MKKFYRTIRLFTVLSGVLLSIHAAAAFDWPQTPVYADSFYSLFGQLRGTVFGTSLIFTEPEEITAAGDGIVLVEIGGESGEMGWFDSPLGNTVIVAHNDKLLSVYANLETVALDDQAEQVSIGTPLGKSGSSGWQQGKSSLEFQIVDTKNKTVINPRMLMPHMEAEQPLRLAGITAVSKQGEVFDLRVRRTLPSGVYLLYRERPNTVMPYKTIVSVNGAAVETITFDMLNRNGNRIGVMGKKNYPVEAVYPDNTRQLLAEVTFSRGKNTLTVTAADINGTEYPLTYILDIK